MTERRVSRTAAVLLLGVLVLLLCASSAGARVEQTDFFTINVKPKSASSSALFLGTTNTSPTAVSLQRYQPGNRFQQWTPVWRTYPGAPEITGGSGVGTAIEEFFSACFVPPWPLPLRCKFPGSTEPRSDLKFVNRGSGLCMKTPSSGPTYSPPAYGNGTPVFQGRCVVGPPNLRHFQTWSTQRVEAANRTESTLWQFNFKPRCLDVKDFREAVGATLQIWQCHGGINWNQQFRFLSVAQVRCEVGVTNKICGVPGSPPTL